MKSLNRMVYNYKHYDLRMGHAIFMKEQKYGHTGNQHNRS